MRIRIILISAFLLHTINPIGIAQNTDANIFGDVQSAGEHIPFANVFLVGTTIGTVTDISGHYMMINLPEGNYILTAQAVGYQKQSREVTLVAGKTLEVNFVLEEDAISLDEVVITGTRTFKRQTESPVIVNVLDGKMLGQIQATSLSEGLCFQPGLRVETDCQTCNYTQLRMNGLGGAYSQILINGRSIFSPLNGLYGLEQIPSNMVEQIEVVRGGGSALYGSSAIGGTVNVITRIPSQNSFELSNTTSLINGETVDNLFNGNLTVLSQKRNSGVSFFATRKNRDFYDHNGDNYSELPKIESNSFGLTSFLKPAHNQKLELSLSSLYEYRFGGEMIESAAYLAQQSEERKHNILMGSLDYDLDFNDYHSSFIAFIAGQQTLRDHYTGIIPDELSDPLSFDEHFVDPPYGDTKNYSVQGGVQLNHTLKKSPGVKHQLTVGAEHLYDDVRDEISAYNYLLDQTTNNTGAFLQSDWEMIRGLTLLSGVRADKHNLVDRVVLNPRFSLLYRLQNYLQVRASWSTGFRAPQAFDSDMHIAFAGGGVSRIRLSEDLKEERSNSLSASVNYDRANETFIAGFTLEGFHTTLNDAFVLVEAGEDEFGLIYEKLNSAGSVVKGLVLELRANYNRKIQLETGYTLQTSEYKEAVAYSLDLPAEKKYLRTPEQYGYYTLTFNPSERFSASLSGVYTGSMKILHIAGAPELPDRDEYKVSDPFFEQNLKVAYTFNLNRIDSGLEIYGGIKNLFNAYQDDFDTGKNRDSNYIYGPGMPRTFYLGLKIKSF